MGKTSFQRGEGGLLATHTHTFCIQNLHVLLNDPGFNIIFAKKKIISLHNNK